MPIQKHVVVDYASMPLLLQKAVSEFYENRIHSWGGDSVWVYLPFNSWEEGDGELSVIELLIEQWIEQNVPELSGLRSFQNRVQAEGFSVGKDFNGVPLQDDGQLKEPVLIHYFAPSMR